MCRYAMLVLCSACCIDGCAPEVPVTTQRDQPLTAEQRQRRIQLLTPIADGLPLSSVDPGPHIVDELIGKSTSEIKEILSLADFTQVDAKRTHKQYFYYPEALFGNAEAPENGALIITIIDDKVETASSHCPGEF